MAAEMPPHGAGPAARDQATTAAAMIRTVAKGALATLDRKTGGPYASLVLVATDTDGAPVLLLSQLALHTKNIAHDPRASLLIEGADIAADPMAGGRVSLSGRIREARAASSRERFLACHPAAAQYADFPDFAFYRLEIETAHLIQGFGRIVDIKGAELMAARKA